jgi:hypothetical protein
LALDEDCRDKAKDARNHLTTVWTEGKNKRWRSAEGSRQSALVSFNTPFSEFSRYIPNRFYEIKKGIRFFNLPTKIRAELVHIWIILSIRFRVFENQTFERGKMMPNRLIKLTDQNIIKSKFWHCQRTFHIH